MLRDISVKALLVIAFLAAGLFPLMIFSLMSNTATRNILKQQAFRQIESIRTIKVHQLRQFFEETKSQVRVLARDPQVRDFFMDMKHWRSHCRTSGKPLRLLSLPGGNFKADSEYHVIHDRYFQHFQYIVNQYHFYDLFLIDSESGLVAFTVLKEPDFGTFLSRTDSPLKNAWQWARKSDDVVLTDTRLYRPSRNVPAQFAVIRVKNGKKILGYLAVQISLHSIDLIMKERTGMGRTGETYLVGEDFLMRSDSFSDPKGHSVFASLSGSVKENGVDTIASRRAINGETGSEIILNYRGIRVLSAYGPVHLGRFTWGLIAEINEREIDRQIAEALNRRILLILLLSFFLLLSLAFLISAFFSREISRVSMETETMINEILRGKLSIRGDPDRVGVDFRGLVSSTNSLIDVFVKQTRERKKMEAVMEYNQRMESIGTLAGGIAHDFNNILTYMFTYSDIIMENLEPDTTEYESMVEIQKAIHRAADLVAQVMTFSRQVRQEKKPIQFVLIVKEIVKLLKATLPKNIRVQKVIEPKDVFVLAEPSQLYQIAMNLCTNAFHAMQETGGVLSVRLEMLDRTKGNFCVLTIEDSGIGMNMETQARIFEPYFTTKPVGQGSGMGLAVVHGIVKQLGGTIHVQSRPGEGTSMAVTLPVIEKKDSFPPSGIQKFTCRGTGKILFVDDEEQIGKSTGKLLRSWGFSVVITTDSRQADTLLRDESMSDYLLVTDLNMPGITGIQLIRNMRLRGDSRNAILLTGYSEMLNNINPETLPGTVILFKPYTPEQLARTIHEVLRSRE